MENNKGELTVVQQANKIIALNEMLKKTEEVVKMSKACNSSYANITLTHNGPNCIRLRDIPGFEVDDIVEITKFIAEYAEKKAEKIRKLLDSYVISKKC